MKEGEVGVREKAQANYGTNESEAEERETKKKMNWK